MDPDRCRIRTLNQAANHRRKEAADGNDQLDKHNRLQLEYRGRLVNATLLTVTEGGFVDVIGFASGTNFSGHAFSMSADGTVGTDVFLH